MATNSEKIKEHVDAIKTEVNGMTDQVPAEAKTMIFAGLSLLEIFLCDVSALADAANR